MKNIQNHTKILTGIENYYKKIKTTKKTKKNKQENNKTTTKCLHS